MHIKLIILLLCAKYSYSSSLKNPPRVELDDGIIVGTNYRTVHGREVHGFFGVPYAAPPIGENRFEVNMCIFKFS